MRQAIGKRLELDDGDLLVGNLIETLSSDPQVSYILTLWGDISPVEEDEDEVEEQAEHHYLLEGESESLP